MIHVCTLLYGLYRVMEPVHCFMACTLFQGTFYIRPVPCCVACALFCGLLHYHYSFCVVSLFLLQLIITSTAAAAAAEVDTVIRESTSDVFVVLSIARGM